MLIKICISAYIDAGADRAPLADKFSGAGMYLSSLTHIAALDPEGCRNVELNESIHSLSSSDSDLCKY